MSEERNAHSEELPFDRTPEDSERARGDSLWSLDAPVAAGRSGAQFAFAEDAQAPRKNHSARDEAGAAPHPFAVSEVARYEPVAELGVGGMGRVISAIDHRLKRQVALKTIVADVHQQPGIERRFAREAWITASLDHPAIVPIFDAGQEHDGRLYYTMRLIRGRTLTAAIRAAEGLPGRLALLRYFLTACEAVAYAHSQQVVHRDLKPENILVGEFGEIQVVDWGLARRLDERPAPDEAGAHGSCGDAHATRIGAIMGTPAYMSPEQAAGNPADARSDVFSLGRVLFEILTGQAPFLNSDAEATLAAIRRGELPSRGAPPSGIPPELIAIVDKALALLPEQRYPDARSLAADLSRFLDGRRVAAYRYSLFQELVRRARPIRMPILVGLVGVVLLTALALWAFWRTRIERDSAITAAHKTRKALAQSDLHLSRALIEQSLAAQGAEAQAEAEVLSAHALTLAESAEARGVLASFALATRPALRERAALPPCQVLRPRRDGALLCIEAGAVSVWSGRPLTRSWQQALKAEDGAWLAGGRKIAVSAAGHRGFVLDAGSGAILRSVGPLLAPRGFSAAAPADSALLLNARGVSLIDGETAELSTYVPCGSDSLHLAAAMSEGAARAIVACDDGRILVLSRQGEVLQRAETGFGGDHAGASAVALSADGTRAVAAALDGRVAVLDATTGEVRARHSLKLGIVHGLLFSPDGRRMLILGDRGGATLWEPDTGRILRRLPSSHDRSAMWSQDGTELLTLGGELRRWALPESLPHRHLLDPQSPGLSAVAPSPRGNYVGVTKGDGTLAVFELPSGRLLFQDRFQSGVLKGASFAADGSGILAWGIGQPSVRQYDAAGRTLQTFDLPSFRRAALLPSGWLIGLVYAPRARLFDLRRGTTQAAVIGDNEFFDAAQSDDGKRVLLLDMDGEIWQVHDRPELPESHRLLRIPGASAVAISHDGSELAVATESDIQVFGNADKTPRIACKSNGQRILDVAFSPDGKWLAAGDLDQNARIWSARDGRLRAVLRGHTGRIAGVAFSRDGRALITASWDGSARLWGLEVLDRPATELLSEAQAAWGLELSQIQGTRAY